MRYYIPGMESKERFELIMQLTNIQSESIYDAMYDHIVKGQDEAVAGMLVDASNLKRALKKFNHVLHLVEQIKQIDWSNQNAKEK